MQRKYATAERKISPLPKVCALRGTPNTRPVSLLHPLEGTFILA